MSPRYALLIDGAFACKKLGQRFRRDVVAADILNESDRIGAHPALQGLDLLRIYFYDAPPAGGKLVHPFTKTEINLGQTPKNASQRALHDSLEMSPNFALRMGEVAGRGWKLKNRAIEDIADTGRQLCATDMRPNLQQKGVDLRIGLDIARLSLRQSVQVIVVVTGDSDIVPAFKFARREGVRVYLECLRHGVKRDLKAHADIIL